MALRNRRPQSPAPPASAGSGAAGGPEPSGREAPAPEPAGAAPSAALAAQATMFIHKAASVLEREVAAGIRAARTLEGQLVDVPSLRQRPADELMQKFREDALDVTNFAMDMLALSVRALENVAQRAIRITARRETLGEAADPARTEMAVLSSNALVRSGETADLEMALENASDEAREVAGFDVTDLVGPAGGRIAAGKIDLVGAPVSVPAQGKAVIRVRIPIPRKTAPGHYFGLMVARQLDQVRALIDLEVAEAPAGPPEPA